jgi:predicted nucleic acid-binding protein
MYKGNVIQARLRIEHMPVGKRRTRLEQCVLDELPRRFEDRVLDINTRIADVWGRVVAHSQTSGRPMSAMDAFIAPTATLIAPLSIR